MTSSTVLLMPCASIYSCRMQGPRVRSVSAAGATPGAAAARGARARRGARCRGARRGCASREACGGPAGSAACVPGWTFSDGSRTAGGVTARCRARTREGGNERAPSSDNAAARGRPDRCVPSDKVHAEVTADASPTRNDDRGGGGIPPADVGAPQSREKSTGELHCQTRASLPPPNWSSPSACTQKVRSLGLYAGSLHGPVPHGHRSVSSPPRKAGSDAASMYSSSRAV